MRRLRRWRGSGAACSVASPSTGVSGLTPMHPSSTIGSWTRAKTVSEGNQVACHHTPWVFDQATDSRWDICTTCHHGMLPFELCRCASYVFTNWYLQPSQHMCFLSTHPIATARVLDYCKSDDNKNAVIKPDQTNHGTRCIVTPGLRIVLLAGMKQHAVGIMGTLSQGKTWQT